MEGTNREAVIKDATIELMETTHDQTGDVFLFILCLEDFLKRK